MKKRSKILPFIVATGTLLNFLVWQQYLGLNILLISLVIQGGFLFFNTSSFKSKKVLFLAVLQLVSAINVVMVNSNLSIITCAVTTLVYALFVHEPRFRNILNALFWYLINFCLAFIYTKEELAYVRKDSIRIKGLIRVLKLFVLPMLIILIFLTIYNNANPIFSNYLNKFFYHINKFLYELFGEINFLWLISCIFCIWLISALMLKGNAPDIYREEQKQDDTLQRVRKKQHPFNNLQKKPQILGLKNEYLSGVITLISLNIIILFLNITDFTTIWTGIEFNTRKELRLMVYEGTGMLIVSILLSKLVLLLLFRKNINFYPKNKWIKVLAYLWIFQNGILLISVFLRNYQYIAYYALGYKRVGVYFYLYLTCFGLITLLLKIYQKKSFFYLLKVNAWNAFGVLIISSFINWDIYIAKYNFRHASETPLDLGLLYELPANTLPLVFENREIIEQRAKELKLKNRYQNFSFSAFARDAKHIVKKKQNWKSWNYNDYKTKMRLLEQKDIWSKLL
ncbi:MAG: DUF4173 domain-containing protein [Chitinophagales bacterium]|nr:DUF4173 domain-containing protein [Chitinophagales bacterium]